MLYTSMIQNFVNFHLEIIPAAKNRDFRSNTQFLGPMYQIENGHFDKTQKSANFERQEWFSFWV